MLPMTNANEIFRNTIIRISNTRASLQAEVAEKIEDEIDALEVRATAYSVVAQTNSVAAVAEAAAKYAQADAQTAAAMCAGLSFAHGLDATAVSRLSDAGIPGAVRIVRRMRIDVADRPHYYNLPLR